MAVSDMFAFENVADDDAKARRAEVTGGAISDMMKMADNSPANSASFDQNMYGLSREDPMMNSYMKNNPVSTAKAMYELKKALMPISPGLAGVK